MSPGLQPNSEALLFMLLMHIFWSRQHCVVNECKEARATYGALGLGDGTHEASRGHEGERDEGLHGD